MSRIEGDEILGSRQGQRVAPLPDRLTLSTLTATTVNATNLSATSLSPVESISFTPVAANPGGVETVWMNSADSQIYLGNNTLAPIIVDIPNSTVAIGPFAGDLTGKYHTICSTHTYATMAAAATANTIYGDTAAGITTGFNNVLIGRQAGDTITTGGNNTLIGTFAGRYVAGGLAITAVGISAAQNMTGLGNVCIGADAGHGKVGSSANWNVCVGVSAGFNLDTGSSNILIGQSAGSAITTGGYNCVIGDSAGTSITIGTQNVTMGRIAGTFVTTGNNNTLIGDAAGSTITTGSGNTSVGKDASAGLTTGSNNIHIVAASATAAETGRIRIGTSGTHTDTYMAGVFASTASTGVVPQCLFTANDGKIYGEFVANVCPKFLFGFENIGYSLALPIINTPVKIAGTYTMYTSVGTLFSQPNPGEIRFDATLDSTGVTAIITLSVRLSAPGTDVVRIIPYINATTYPAARATLTNTAWTSVTVALGGTLPLGGIIAVWAANETSATGIDIYSMSVTGIVSYAR